MLILLIILNLIFFFLILFIDVKRFFLIINKYSNINKNYIYKAISLSSIFGIFLPFRASDIIGIIYLRYIENKISIYLLIATYFLIRLIDAIIILFIFLILYNFQINIYLKILTPVILVITLMTAVVLLKSNISKILFFTTSIFNKNFQLIILKIFWNIWNIIKLSGYKRIFELIFNSILLWIINIIILLNFQLIINKNFTIDNLKIIFFEKYIDGFNKAKIYNLDTFSLDKNYLIENFYSIFFIPISIFFVSFLTFIFFWIIKNNNENQYKDKEKSIKNYLNKTKYIDNFILEIFKIGSSKKFTNLFNNSEILDQFDGKSGAKIFLFKDYEKNTKFIKKFSIDKVISYKLDQQYMWLKKNSDQLPLTIPYDYHKFGDISFFKMNVGNKFEKLSIMINNFDELNIKEISKEIINSINWFKNYKKLYSKEKFNNYLDEKIINNLKKIKNYKIFEELENYDYLLINQKKYKTFKNFDLKKIFFNEYEEISKFETITTHGDLTFENIIVENNKDLYFIDPSPNNIYNNIFIDFACLLQSSYLKIELYEFNKIKIENNKINYALINNNNYDIINYLINDQLKKYSLNGLRYTYMFLIIKILRNIPHLIKINNPEFAKINYIKGIKLVNKIIEQNE